MGAPIAFWMNLRYNPALHGVRFHLQLFDKCPIRKVAYLSLNMPLESNLHLVFSDASNLWYKAKVEFNIKVFSSSF